MKKLLLCAFGLLTACALADGPTPAPLFVQPTVTLWQLPSATPSPTRPARLPTETPLPPLPPLPTATPIAYVIQKGDTLIGIAVEHNISLEALEAANPGIDPGNLQIGGTVLIPPPGGEAAPNQINAPTPLPVAIGSFNCHPTPVGSLICLGEFTNSTQDSIANLSARVTLLNPDDSFGDSLTAYAPLDLIPPGAAVPLGVVFPNGAGHTAVAEPLTADSGAGLADLYTMLTVSEVVSAETTAGLNLKGTIINPASTPVNRIAIVGSVYNSAGAVIDYRRITLTEPLAPEANVSFEMIFPGVGSAARWAVIAQGRTR
ncbi:MAG TPA: LysM peptidoglycan-binding domain-containing protein [Anaerolineales bacterium]|nr:LysM peptidoglycan-binding domain-containing protein [Anaerolineales bacterium]